MNIMATQITGKKFPQFRHTEKGTLLLWDLAYRDNLVLLHVKIFEHNLANLFETSCISYKKSSVHSLNYMYILSSSEKLYSFVLFCMFEVYFFSNTVKIFNDFNNKFCIMNAAT